MTLYAHFAPNVFILIAVCVCLLKRARDGLNVYQILIWSGDGRGHTIYEALVIYYDFEFDANILEFLNLREEKKKLEK